MKRKWLAVVSMLLLLAVLSIPAAFADAKAPDPQENRPQLTEAQKEELKQIHEETWNHKKELVEKYKSFGVINEEKAEKILERMNEKRKRIEEKGFEPHLRMREKKRRR